MPTFKTPKPIKLVANLHWGSLVLEAQPDVIETVIDVQPKDPNCQRDVDEASRVTVEWDAPLNTLRITAHAPENDSGAGGWLQYLSPWPRRGTVVVTGSFPAHSSVELKNKSGRIAVRGEIRRADVDSGDGVVELGIVGKDGARIRTANGAITVSHSTGDLDVATRNGRVTISDCSGHVVADSSNGHMDISGGASVRVTTRNGRIDVGASNGDVTAETANGPVRLGYVVRGRVNVNTRNGRIDVGVARGSAVNVEQARTYNGTVKNELGDPTPGKPGDGDKVSLSLLSNNGSIALERADAPAQLRLPPSPSASGSAAADLPPAYSVE
jgi:hypothetical protein